MNRISRSCCKKLRQDTLLAVDGAIHAVQRSAEESAFGSNDAMVPSCVALKAHALHYAENLVDAAHIVDWYRDFSGARRSGTGFYDIPTDEWYASSGPFRLQHRVERLAAFREEVQSAPDDTFALFPCHNAMYKRRIRMVALAIVGSAITCAVAAFMW